MTPADAAVEAALEAARRPQPLQVATPINDNQLIVLAAAELFGFMPQSTGIADAVSVARDLFIEAVVQNHEAPLAGEIMRRLSELHPSEATPAGQQFLIPGVQ